MWYEKFFYTIARGVFNIRKLEKLETEKTVRVEGTSRSLDGSLSDVAYKPIDIKDRYHPSLQGADKWFFPLDFALSFGLLTDLGIFGSVGTFPDIRSNSWLVFKCFLWGRILSIWQSIVWLVFVVVYRRWFPLRIFDKMLLRFFFFIFQLILV